MYCSSCGIEVTQELNYCNRCGANLNPPANLVPQMPPPPPKLTGPTIALGLTVVLSLAAIFGGIDNLALRGVHPTAIAWIAIISLGMVFGVAALFIRLWTNLLTNAAAHTQQPPAQLKKPQPAAQLPAPQTGPMNVPLSSVTDHTTRTFEPAYRERAEREKRG
jgi:hypothetical protein